MPLPWGFGFYSLAGRCLRLHAIAMAKKPKNPTAVKLALMRKDKLSPARRTEIAKQAATARWARKGK